MVEFEVPPITEQLQGITIQRIGMNEDQLHMQEEMRRLSLQTDEAAFWANVPEELDKQLLKDRERIANGEMTPFMLMQNNIPVSMATLYKRLDEQGETHYELWYVYTQKEKRGRGLSPILLTCVFDYAEKELKWPHIELSVFFSQAPARKMYENLGFKWTNIEWVEKANKSLHVRDIMRLTFSKSI